MNFTTLTTLGSGQIDALGDSDLFELSLDSGKQYQVTVRGEVDFELITQNDVSSANTAVEQAFNLTQPFMVDLGGDITTTFYVEAGESYFANVSTRFTTFFDPIPYDIDIIEITDDVLPTAASTASAAVGAPFSGVFEFAGDQDWIRLDVGAGENYTVNSDALFSVVGIDQTTGARVGEPQSSFSATGFGVAGQTGFYAQDGVDYYAALLGGNAFGEVSYGITIGTLLSDVADTADTSLSASAGAPAQGQVNAVGDYDWVRLNTTAGDSYVVTVDLSVGASQFGVYNLIETDTASGEIIDVYENLNTRLPFSAKAGSTYFAEIVPTATAVNTGVYEVTLETYEDDFVDNLSTAAALDLSGTTTILGETSGDRDFIRLDVEAGQSYLVSSDLLNFDIIREDQTAINSYNTALGTDFEDIRVDTSGLDLANNRFVSKLDVESGFEYYIAAQFGSLFAPQEVTFTLEETAPEITDNASTTARVGANETLAGILETASDQDWILIDVAAGQSATVSVSGFILPDSLQMFAVSGDGNVELLGSQEFFAAFNVGHQTVVNGRSDADIYLQVGTVENINLGGVQNSSYSISVSPVTDAEPNYEGGAIVLGNDETSNPDPLVVNGTDGDDILTGGAADNVITGGLGDDAIDGGAGTDTATFAGRQADYTLTLSSGQTRIEDRLAARSGTDTLTDIELIDFDTDVLDGPFDLTQFGGAASLNVDDFENFIELYIAYFNRAPDAIGLNFWGTAFANGTSLSEMASLFIDQEETRATYPEGQSNTDFVTAVYNNVLGRIPDQLGFEFWVDTLNTGSVGADLFILSVLDGASAPAPDGATQEFIDQAQADRDYLANKTDLGAYFSVHRGMSDVDNASAAMAIFDGSQSSLDAAVNAIDGFFDEASAIGSGEFLIQVVGVLTDPFAG